MGAHSHIYLWVHCVWHTKGSEDVLQQPLRARAIHHILEYAQEKGYAIDRINGYTDHLHCLVRLRSDQTIAEVIGAIKGESSHWINYEGLTEERFAWQNGFSAFSVSASHLPSVRRYIDRQEIRHGTKGQSYHEEIRALKQKYEEMGGSN